MLLFYKHVLIVLFILICLICMIGNFIICSILFNPKLPELPQLQMVKGIIIVNILVIPILIYLLLKFLW